MYDHRKVVNIYIVYEISRNFNISSYSTLENSLFAAVSFTKNAILININILNTVLDLIDIYDIRFDRFFPHPSGGNGTNIIIFGVDISSSSKIDNRNKYILV